MRAIKEKTTRKGNLLATPLFLEIYPNECKGKYQITDKLLSGGFRPSDRGMGGGGGGGGGGGEWARSQKNFLSALRASVWSKNKGT